MDAGVEELWPGGYTLVQRPRVFRLGTDAMVLADFATVRRGWRVCDLGCGGGILPVMLLARMPGLAVTAVDLSPAACAAAEENLTRNGLEGRVIRGDIRDEGLLRGEQFHLVVSNPPYFGRGTGGEAAGARGLARDERACTIADLCRAAARLTRTGGRFAVVYRPERLADLICALRANGLEPKRLRLVQHRAGGLPSLVLVESVRQGGAGLEVLPPLVLYEADERRTAECRRIYRREE